MATQRPVTAIHHHCNTTTTPPLHNRDSTVTPPLHNRDSTATPPIDDFVVEGDDAKYSSQFKDLGMLVDTVNKNTITKLSGNSTVSTFNTAASYICFFFDLFSTVATAASEIEASRLNWTKQPNAPLEEIDHKITDIIERAKVRQLKSSSTVAAASEVYSSRVNEHNFE